MKREGIPDLLIVSTVSRQAFLAEKGIDSHVVPLGYNPSHGRDLGLVRDVDALFIGVMSDPKHRRAARSIRAQGVDLIAKGAWTLAEGLWGEQRLEMINRARTFLAFQRNPGELSGMRMILGMACRSLIISEPIVSPEPYVPGIHYVSVSLADMPEAIRYYIDNDAERARIADAGHRFITTELTLERSVRAIIELAGLA
jgi:glycosyltransferase involved in cell wall biosynthesis